MPEQTLDAPPSNPVEHGREATMVRGRTLSRSFDDVSVVDGIDLDVPAGTIQGIVGPSGSGKTTTVRMLTGALPPTSGTASIFGQDPRLLSTEQRQRVGYMPQQMVLYPHLTVRQNLRFAASIYGLRRIGDHIADAVALVDLQEAIDRPLADCSGGMQRRVSLAAALMHEPEVLFLDEPTSGLDPVLRQRLWGHFEELKEAGRALVVTTQIVSEAQMCDRVGLIVEGKLIADDTPEALRRRAMGGETIDLHLADDPSDAVRDLVAEHDAVVRVLPDQPDPQTLRVVVADAESAIVALSAWLAERDHTVTLAERYLHPFDDVFVALLQGER